MTGRELDAAIAEQVMGWQRQPHYNYWMTFAADGTFELHELIASWSPSTNIAQATEVEKQLEKLGHKDQYSSKLYAIVRAGEISGTWRLIHATPEERCLAAIATLGT